MRGAGSWGAIAAGRVRREAAERETIEDVCAAPPRRCALADAVGYRVHNWRLDQLIRAFGAGSLAVIGGGDQPVTRSR